MFFCDRQIFFVIVIVISNYKIQSNEEVPFKAKIISKYNTNIVVKSQTTYKEYILHDHQILEGLEIEEIKNFFDMIKYGL